MALYGILGGIDGNLEALRAALAAFEARGVRKILCAGDVVGCNADPDECGDALRARKAFIVAGSHDRVASGLRRLADAPNAVRYGLARTRRELRRDTAAWLRSLPESRVLDHEIALLAGDVRDIRADFPAARVCVFAHGPEQKLYDATGELQELPAASRQLERARLYFINAGSVDAQRKRGPRLAECAVFDSDTWTIDFLKLRYDAAATEAKAAVAGYRILPAMDALYTMQRHAARLPRAAEQLARAVQAFSAELVRRRVPPRSPA